MKFDNDSFYHSLYVLGIVLLRNAQIKIFHIKKRGSTSIESSQAHSTISGPSEPPIRLMVSSRPGLE